MDELENEVLVERHKFYAVTPSRRFPNLILRELMKPKIERRRLCGAAKGVAIAAVA